MVFNVSGSGSVSAGSWKFKVLAAKPATASKNSLIAISATTPTTTTVSDEPPASPVENDVWFHIVNPEDGKVFSDGSVPIQLLGAYAWHAAGESATAATSITGGVIAVAAATFRTKVDGRTCAKVFTYNGSAWTLGGAVVTLADYGITVSSGTPATGNTITVTYVSGWALLTSYYSYCGVWHDMIGLPPVGTPLESCSWAQIGRISAAGKAGDYFSVGDTKTVILSTSETITLRIIDFAHDDLSSNGGGKAPITFDVVDCMATAQKMNATNTNVGGYSGCAFYSTLTNTIFNSLPADLRAVVKEVNKKTSAGNQSATIVTTAEKIFLLAEVEVHGSITYAKTGEGTQYALYTNGGSKVKKIGATASYWWLRSPYASNATGFCYVTSDGTAHGSGASYSNGVAFGLCV